MIPYTKTDLPITIKYDLEMMRLLLEATELYSKYNSMLKYKNVDQGSVLKPFILQESFKSCEMTGNKTLQGSLYYMRFNTITDDTLDIINYNDVLINIEKYLTKSFKLSMGYLNKIHKDLNNSYRGEYQSPGKLRSKLTWIGKRGSSIYTADFVPCEPRDIPVAMGNFIRFFNKRYELNTLIEIAISHAQFENIHPYQDANGRLGRILVPIHAFLDGESHVSLFISEVLKENEYTYYKKLQDTRNGNWESYIKFFLELVIKQLKINIEKLNKVYEVYEKDSVKVIELLKPKNGLKVYDYMFSNITFTVKEMSNDLHIDYQTIRNYILKLFNRGLVSKHKINKGEYVYTYINMYNIHVPVDWI